MAPVSSLPRAGIVPLGPSGQQESARLLHEKSKASKFGLSETRFFGVVAKAVLRNQAMELLMMMMNLAADNPYSADARVRSKKELGNMTNGDVLILTNRNASFDNRLAGVGNYGAMAE
ncbi:hypothetical protein Daesc_005248 [Daldinia eschscholtzii]|uniref:Uncharacterized protein n=1 Tax=Daldinia eschscholtzii TaxID=292717 RepID=A0AAX6ML91_9PEZI